MFLSIDSSSQRPDSTSQIRSVTCFSQLEMGHDWHGIVDKAMVRKVSTKDQSSLVGDSFSDLSLPRTASKSGGLERLSGRPFIGISCFRVMLFSSILVTALVCFRSVLWPWSWRVLFSSESFHIPGSLSLEVGIFCDRRDNT